MTARRPFARTIAIALLAGLASRADGKTREDCEREYTPQRAQEGKDVIWAPTEDAMVDRMLELAKVTPADIVYDLGAGDGKIPIAAAKRFGAKAVGIEYDAGLVKHARCLVEAEGVEPLVEIVEADLFESDFSSATVVTMYLLPALNLRLRPTLLEMKPGTRIASYSFTMGDWEPDAFFDSDFEGSVYLWIVPARVAGRWTFRPADGGEAPRFEVTFDQTFQHLKGVAGGATLMGKLDGEVIGFDFARDGEPVSVRGTVEGDRIRAQVAHRGEPLEYVGTRN